MTTQLTMFSPDLTLTSGDRVLISIDDPHKPDETHRLAKVVAFHGDTVTVDFTDADGNPRSRGIVWLDQVSR